MKWSVCGFTTHASCAVGPPAPGEQCVLGTGLVYSLSALLLSHWIIPGLSHSEHLLWPLEWGRSNGVPGSPFSFTSAITTRRASLDRGWNSPSAGLPQQAQAGAEFPADLLMLAWGQPRPAEAPSWVRSGVHSSTSGEERRCETFNRNGLLL